MDSLSPHQVERILSAGVLRGITERQIGRVNSTLDQWQHTIQKSNRPKVVEKYQRLLHQAVAQLHFVSLIYGDDLQSEAEKQYVMLYYLANELGIGIHVKDLNSLIAEYAEEMPEDDDGDSDGYPDYCGICLEFSCNDDCWP